MMLGEDARRFQNLFPATAYGFVGNTLSHLTMTHAFDNRTAHGFDGAFWSISLEWQFYLMFLPLAAIARTRILLSLLIPALTTLIFRAFFSFYNPEFLLTYVGNELSVGRWVEFAAGMAAAHVVARRPTSATLGGPTGLVALCTLASAAATYEVATGGYGTFLPVCWSVVGCFTIVQAGSNRIFRRVLESPPLLWLGGVSYSVYLIHGSVMMMLATILTAVGTNNDLYLWTMLIFATPLSILAGAIFFRCVERNFLPATVPRHAAAPVDVVRP